MTTSGYPGSWEAKNCLGRHGGTWPGEGGCEGERASLPADWLVYHRPVARQPNCAWRLEGCYEQDRLHLFSHGALMLGARERLKNFFFLL